MQNSAVDVEANMLIRREKLKAEKRENIDAEQSISLEVKLDILEEKMQNIINRNEYVFQDHVSLVEENQVADMKHFHSYPNYHKSNNCLRYALRDNK